MKKPFAVLVFALATCCLFSAGCSEHRSTSSQADHESKGDNEAKIEAALQKLSPEDRKLAQEQKYCAVQTKSRLGSMDKPIKVVIKDQPVFLCCKSCQKEATADADKTLATVAKLKAANTKTETK